MIIWGSSALPGLRSRFFGSLEFVIKVLRLFSVLQSRFFGSLGFAIKVLRLFSILQSKFFGSFDSAVKVFSFFFRLFVPFYLFCLCFIF
ncbi:hypothetical protein GLOIN_2v1877681 [Rhizophagus irregularis DAOM 181602=DAOM 197198]|uniref:Uncharacterized protein n=1 Tax=Rhizophagus irregularis (strain DAOM 181602 / DAOM 197198 / MUCL 43194) TaxID=747089 RepID=A0A2P4PUY6_RHIID|nr:hypothetical protein GLOIN_2v1877681 [Rhizophagus irregularis DAOM 181602=DAOM 197198]POG69213.1 hypothetical protein GLOIN_2v1877681 [Rhizophagus irregularis DAOM 181602=DAOM 197198]|eukprot:XP_025176079.1 hypothetical protein GLOIN_2v1877681 [Rhizophagus irregularis DAOM 181602=DAOM 197198]